MARLEAAGFRPIRERDNWSAALRPGGKYYLTRNGSSVVAFAIGAKWRPGNPVAMIAAHTDSPCLRLKPVSKKTGAGFMQVGVETYGGGIWHTWFDRDLSIAGRLMVRDGDGAFAPRLVRIDRPILRIPTLAIHLDRASEFKPNSETELFPIAGLVAAELDRLAGDAKPPADDAAVADDGDSQPLDAMAARHHPYILQLVADQAGVDVAAVAEFELVLFDTQKSCLGGLHDEFVFSPRLDNLGMTYCAVMGLVASLADPATALDDDPTIRLISCFDHEEVGSLSAHGANSNLLPAVLRRLSVVPAAAAAAADDGGSSDSSYHHVDPDLATAFEQTCSTSFLISADMAHAVHPNYEGKYESSHRPQMNRGTVIKVNANQRYTTNSPGVVLLNETARLAGVPLQLFVVRNDSPCGSTIGPMLSAKMGVRTLDLGNPQLSMHSIRETGGSHDVEHGIRLFESFLSNYATLEPKIVVD